MSDKKAFELVQEYKPINVPYQVCRIFGSKTLEVMGDQICLDTRDGDYVSLAEARKAIKFYVDQLGGTVKWTNKSK